MKWYCDTFIKAERQKFSAFLTVCIFLCKIVCRAKQNSPKQTDREQTRTAQFLLTFQVLTLALRMQGANIQTRPHSLRVYFENQPGLRYWLKLPLTTQSCQMPRDYMKNATCRKRYTKVCKTIQRTRVRGVRFWCALDPTLPSPVHFRRQWRNLTAFSKIDHNLLSHPTTLVFYATLTFWYWPGFPSHQHSKIIQDSFLFHLMGQAQRIFLGVLEWKIDWIFKSWKGKRKQL